MDQKSKKEKWERAVVLWGRTRPTGCYNCKHFTPLFMPETGAKWNEKLLAQYGKALLCVRYRYDERRGVRLKTVELVAEERTGVPMFLLQDGDMVPIEVRFEETELGERLQDEGKIGFGAKALDGAVSAGARN